VIWRDYPPKNKCSPITLLIADDSEYKITLLIADDSDCVLAIPVVLLILLFTVLLLSLVVVPTARWLQRWKRSRRLHDPFPETTVTATSTTYTQAAATVTDIELL
jgi:hypothetical protein